MRQESGEKLYQIGEFAHHLGVTPDFLKHYAQFRLISPTKAENGYRYYTFKQSYTILRCMGLHNYGVPVREMAAMLYDDDLPTMKEKLDRQAEEMRRRIQLDQAILEDHQALTAWMDRMQGKEEDWSVAQGEEMYFLPHFRQFDFFEDERLYAILKSWVAWIPIVKSCIELHCQNTPTQHISAYSHGLILPKRLAEKYQIPINGVVKRIPQHKLFRYDFIRHASGINEERSLSPVHQAQEKLQQMGLRCTGDIHKVMLLSTHLDQDDRYTQHGFFLIPIE